MRGHDLKPWIQPLVWLLAAGMLLVQPGSAMAASERWVIILLLFSPLVLMPLWHGTPATRWRRELETAAAIVLAGSFMRAPGLEAALFAAPWLAARLLAAWETAQTWRGRRLPGLGRLCIDLAAVFPAIGAAWLVAHRAGWTPWGFDPLIVLLTAAHFHHAGFTLPLAAGLHAEAAPGRAATWACACVLAGVPLVAAGITGTHFGVLPWVEAAGVAVLAGGALLVALLQMARGFSAVGMGSLRRAGFLVSGASLLAAMLLALGFGLRYLVPGFALTLPQMWMIHGTLNAFGFGFCGLLAWRHLPPQN